MQKQTSLFGHLNSAKKSLFRFESLQTYMVKDEDMSDSGMAEWWDFIKKKKKEGVKMQRVRLVTRPYSEYLRKELPVHRKSAKTGDDIRLINVATLKKLKIPTKDFWLIDDSIYIDMQYTKSGKYVGFSVWNADKDALSIKSYLVKFSKKL